MIKGSEIRRADYPIDALFIDRWSPRAMSGEGIPEHELMRLFEAARWAPSSRNAQPWRMLYAQRESAQWPLFLDLLFDMNKTWAGNAAALVLFVSRRINDRTDKPSITHSFDAGAAWGFFALQGFLQGYAVHGIEGFDYERAQTALGIPKEFQVEAMAAVGKPAPKDILPPALQEREAPNGRRALMETVCQGKWLLKG